MRPKQKRKLLFVAIALCITVAIVAGLFLIPVGTCIQVSANTYPYGVDINGCSLRKVYMLSHSSQQSSSFDGDRVLVMKVFEDQTEISTVEKANVTKLAGSYFIDSPILPSDLSANSELRVIVQLRDSTGDLIAEVETSLLFK